MTTRTSEIGAKQRHEIEDIVMKIMRLMVDLTCEEKRVVTTEVDRLVSFKESSTPKPRGGSNERFSQPAKATPLARDAAIPRARASARASR